MLFCKSHLSKPPAQLKIIEAHHSAEKSALLVTTQCIGATKTFYASLRTPLILKFIKGCVQCSVTHGETTCEYESLKCARKKLLVIIDMSECLIKIKSRTK